MNINPHGIAGLPIGTPGQIYSNTAEFPGSWSDWTIQLTRLATIGDSGSIFKLAEKLAASAAISNESATALLLWLGSVCMIQQTQIRWPTGIWYPSGLVLATVESDDVQIDSITNAFIAMARSVGLDPISDTVKEGPAGLIARLESAGRPMGQQHGSVKVDSLGALAALDTGSIAERDDSNRGNGRALIYPSGRAILSYLYDTPFFNALDELVQHGHLSIRGKVDRHQMHQVHLSMFVGFYQGALVNLTTDTRVQSNMLALLRQMLVLWPTSGTRRHKRPTSIADVLVDIARITTEGINCLRGLSDGQLAIPILPETVDDGYISAGVGVRYTMLNRAMRISKIAIAVAFWRIASGGTFEITNSDCAVAEAILHSHEMGGRLMELAMSKGKMGHEFMRVFLRLLDGESIEAGQELDQATEINAGATAVHRLGDMSVLEHGKLSPEYRFIQGTTIARHKKRWNLT